MSIKIYNGLKAVSQDPFDVMKQVKNVLEPIFFDKVAQLLQKLVDLRDNDPERFKKYMNFVEKVSGWEGMTSVDGHTVYRGMQASNRMLEDAKSLEIIKFLEGLDNQGLLNFELSTGEVLKIEDLYVIMQMLYRKPEFTGLPEDLFYEVHLLPSTSGVLGLVFSADHDYVKALRDSGVMVDYGYWDNSDADEDVSEEEWEQRGKDWQVVMDDTVEDASLRFSQPGIYATILNPKVMEFRLKLEIE